MMILKIKIKIQRKTSIRQLKMRRKGWRLRTKNSQSTRGLIFKACCVLQLKQAKRKSNLQKNQWVLKTGHSSLNSAITSTKEFRYPRKNFKKSQRWRGDWHVRTCQKSKENLPWLANCNDSQRSFRINKRYPMVSTWNQKIKRSTHSSSRPSWNNCTLMSLCPKLTLVHCSRVNTLSGFRSQGKKLEQIWMLLILMESCPKTTGWKC